MTVPSWCSWRSMTRSACASTSSHRSWLPHTRAPGSSRARPRSRCSNPTSTTSGPSDLWPSRSMLTGARGGSQGAQAVHARSIDALFRVPERGEEELDDEQEIQRAVLVGKAAPPARAEERRVGNELGKGESAV